MLYRCYILHDFWDQNLPLASIWICEYAELPNVSWRPKVHHLVWETEYVVPVKGNAHFLTEEDIKHWHFTTDRLLRHLRPHFLTQIGQNHQESRQHKAVCIIIIIIIIIIILYWSFFRSKNHSLAGLHDYSELDLTYHLRAIKSCLFLFFEVHIRVVSLTLRLWMWQCWLRQEMLRKHLYRNATNNAWLLSCTKKGREKKKKVP